MPKKEIITYKISDVISVVLTRSGGLWRYGRARSVLPGLSVPPTRQMKKPIAGRLGRTHVCALKRGDDLEVPSDFEGVVYVTFDNSDGWKQALGRELAAADFDVNWSKAMGVRP